MLAQLYKDNVWIKVVAPDYVHNVIAKRLEYRINPAQLRIINARRGSRWNGVCNDLYQNNRFLTGMLEVVAYELDQKGIQYKLIDTRDKSHQVTPKIVYPIRLGDITLYDYQEQTVKRFFKAVRGVAKLATGAGKTECAIAIAKILERPTLFMTNRVNLVYQTAQRFADRWPEAKDGIGIVGNSQFSPSFLTFATVQTLHSALKKHPEETKELLSSFGLLIIDEAHRVGAKQFYETAQHCTAAIYRLALTATPFMSGNFDDNMYLLGTTGPVFHEVSNDELIKRGILAKPFFRFITIDQPYMKPSRNDSWNDIYVAGIINNVYRNNVICTETQTLIKMNRKPLIICSRVEHCKNLAKLFDHAGIKAKVVMGANTYAERKKALNALSKGRTDAIIATTIFDEGVDAKEIDAVVMAAGNRASVPIYQRVGRAIRKKEIDNNAVILDFIDKQHPKLYRQSAQRYHTVRNEKGFVII